MIIPEKPLGAIELIKQTMATILSKIHSAAENELEVQMYLDDICEKLTETFLYEITKFKRQRNSLSFFSRLPPELFSYIIRLSNGYNKARRYSELSRVSYTWRRAIIADAKLWTTIHLDWTLDILNTVLARSKGAKLSVEFSTDDPSSTLLPKVESIFTSRRDHIEKLKVILVGTGFRCLNKFVGQLFPNLKHLTIMGFLSETLNGIPFASDKSTIQTLRLLCSSQEFTTDPPIAAFRSVQSLTLDFSNRGLYKAFLREAHTFMHLEKLFVVCGDDDETWRNDQTPIFLPNLTTLLSSGPLTMTSIMTRLQTPKLIHYGIETTSCQTLEPDWHPIFDSFDYSAIRFLRVKVIPVFNILHIYGYSEQESLGIHFFERSSYSLFSKSCRNGSKWFSIRLDDSALEAFLQVFSALLSRTTSLCSMALDFYHSQEAIQPEFDDQESHFTDFVSSIPSALGLLEEANTLRHLEIVATTDHFTELVNVLGEGSHCPKLETLVFRFANGERPSGLISEDLISFVESRGRTGIPLQLLALEECHPHEDEKRLTRLESFGTRITFNAGHGFIIGV